MYRLITDYREENLEKKVSLALKEGWKLYGNPIMDLSDGNHTFAQAVVK